MSFYTFGDSPRFECHPQHRRLLADGKPVPIGARALAVLAVLVGQHGRVVGSGELLRQAWPGESADAELLALQLRALRNVLGEEAIETTPDGGHRLALKVHGAPPPQGGPAPEASGPQGADLAAEPKTLIGRDDDLAFVKRLLDQHRQVTVLGPGGMGKTLLAQHMLRREQSQWAHGVCFVELAAVDDAALLVGALASALKVSANGPDTQASLCRSLASLQLLLVLDGAEHLAAVLAPLAQTLLDAAPGLRLLVTSQVPLKLRDERLYRLGPLGLPPAGMAWPQALGCGALALFMERARAADPQFSLDAEQGAAAVALCRALEGLPLAIELAAWRVPQLGVQGLAASMHERLQVLDVPQAGVPPRLQTLRNTLAWSHGLLDDTSQVVLRRMGVLQGSAELDVLQQVVCDARDPVPIDSWALHDALTVLTERSLVSTVPGWRGGQRYRLLDTPRSFALEQLAAAGEGEQAQRRLALAMSRRMADAFQARYSQGVHVGSWSPRNLLDLDNARAAVAWLRTQATPAEQTSLGLPLLTGLLRLMPIERQAELLELVALCRRVACEAEPGQPAVLALQVAAQCVVSLDPQQALVLVGLAFERMDGPGAVPVAPQVRYRALTTRALGLLMQGQQLDVALAVLQQARALESAHWPAALRLLRSVPEMWLADRQEDPHALYAASYQFREFVIELGYERWFASRNMVNGALAAGRLEEAVVYGRSQVRHLQGTRHTFYLVEARINLMGALAAAGHTNEGLQHARAAWFDISAHSRPDAWADNMALLLAQSDRPEAAARLLGYSQAWGEQHQVPRSINETTAHQRAHGLLLDDLGEQRLGQLFEAGRSLSVDAITALLYSDAPTPAPSPRQA